MLTETESNLFLNINGGNLESGVYIKVNVRFLMSPISSSSRSLYFPPGANCCAASI